MSLDAALHSYLSGILSVGSRVFPMGKRPQQSTLESVTYQLVAGPGSHYSHGGVSDHLVSYQLDCWADSEDGAVDLDLELVAALDGFSGYWGSYRIGSCFMQAVYDAPEPKVGLYRRTRQIEVHYQDPVGS